MNEQRTMHNFVAAVSPDQVTIEPARADLIRRQDVVQTVDRMITGYMTQQGALLDQVQGDSTHNGFLSGADQVRERRKTSGMYLFTYGTVSAMTVGGLAYLGTLAGVDGAAALAGWMAGTGALTMILAWIRHGDEFRHSPEGLARHLLDWHGDVASYESETRRLSIRWEHDAEERRQAAQERAAEYARQQAQLRIDELDARRKAIEAQRAQADPYEGRFRVACSVEPPQTAIAGVGRTETALQVSSIDDDVQAPTDATTGGRWRDSLLVWLAGIYQPGVVTEAGVIRTMVPWSARSSWTEQDKAEARRIMCEMKPALIVHDGNRWRLRTEVVSDVEQALQLVRQRL